MGLVALLFAHHGATIDAVEPLGALDVAGISIIERQARQARMAGAKRVFILAERMPPCLALALDRAHRDAGVEIMRSPAALAAHICADDAVLTIEEGLIVDERVVEAVIIEEGGSTIAVWSANGAPDRAERIDAARFSGGVGLYTGALVRETVASIGEWDLQATLLRAAAGIPATRHVDLGTIDDYAPGRRRRVPLTWGKPRDAAEGRRMAGVLLAAAQKGCLDWPARFIHPPIENALVQLLLPTPITPNMVTIATGIAGFAATAAFAKGWLWLGLLLALLIGPLDGVDGKLARTRLEFSRWGDLEHVLDKIVEYGWYLALAWHFDAHEGRSGAWALAAIIILFALAEAVQGEFFRRFTGAQLDDAGSFERRFRLISGRRNTFFWILLPFAAFGAWYAGFATIAAYSALTFFVMQTRFFARMQTYGRVNSAQIDANFRATAYAFLSGTKASASDTEL